MFNADHIYVILHCNFFGGDVAMHAMSWYQLNTGNSGRKFVCLQIIWCIYGRSRQKICVWFVLLWCFSYIQDIAFFQRLEKNFRSLVVHLRLLESHSGPTNAQVKRSAFWSDTCLNCLLYSCYFLDLVLHIFGSIIFRQR